jgi:hypothetical protein
VSQGQGESSNLHGAIYNPAQSHHLKQKSISKAMLIDQLKPKQPQTFSEGYSADYELKITIL